MVIVEKCTEKDYEDIVKDTLKSVYKFCQGEMCEFDADKDEFCKVPYPKGIYFLKGLNGAVYKGQDEVFVYPKLDREFDLMQLYSTSAHEMAHHFHKNLQKFKLKDLNVKTIEKGKVKMMSFPEFMEKNSEQNLEFELVKTLKDNAERKRANKWIEGVAYRIEERFLSGMKGHPDSFISKEYDVQHPERYISDSLRLRSSPSYIKGAIRTSIKNANASFEKPDIVTKLRSMSDMFKYLKNSNEGWLTVRKMPRDEFKILLKDGNAHNKIDWSKK